MRTNFLSHVGKIALAVLVASCLVLEQAGAQGMGDPGQGRFGHGMFKWYFAGTLPRAALNGTVLIDSTMGRGMSQMSPRWKNYVYFLDTAGTSQRAYQLFFGPYWYTPKGTLVRPEAGESVTVSGGLDTTLTPPVLVVYNLNGISWRDSTGAPPWAGRWFYKASAESTEVVDPLDSLTSLTIPPGAISPLLLPIVPDSIYMLLQQAEPDSQTIAPPHVYRTLLTYQVEAFLPDGTQLSELLLRAQLRFRLQQELTLRFHVPPDSLMAWGGSFSSLQLRYFDIDSVWKVTANVTYDSVAGTLTLRDSTLYTGYSLTTPAVTAVRQEQGTVPESYGLAQNYPNPFNPSTTISFDIPTAGLVSLEVYNSLGQQLATLVQEELAPGSYKVTWNASTLPSGAYFYRIRSGSFVSTKTALLVK